eukprot:TRINITY_DN15965_c0_g1_i1.p1 TRINITY_DN15965_c0_g1~~TRINITY_DN15965_c0_g1_i1.p1  ORF type:complete len:239 (+),score=42.02 TRINITY_DN15965_c0_g1_i1:24-719(+)
MEVPHESEDFHFGRSSRQGTSDEVNLYIAISGLIGSGKSTLADALGKTMRLPVFHEQHVESELLADFYRDTATYSFPLQIYLLNQRFRQQQQIIWSGRGAVQDRTIYEDSVFAKMLRDAHLMEDRNYRTYIALFNNMSSFMKRPNLIIHLDVTAEESLERIKSRGRACEQSISLDYLKNLRSAYEDFIREISRVIPVIRVRWDQFHNAEEMAQTIKKEYTAMQNVRLVHFR